MEKSWRCGKMIFLVAYSNRRARAVDIFDFLFEDPTYQWRRSCIHTNTLTCQTYHLQSHTLSEDDMIFSCEWYKLHKKSLVDIEDPEIIVMQCKMYSSSPSDRIELWTVKHEDDYWLAVDVNFADIDCYDTINDTSLSFPSEIRN